MATVEILVTGNELLSGAVADTNGAWLCGRLTALGARVRRVTLLPDELPEIAGAVRDALGRAPDLLLTVGGMGPTEDDCTVAAVAEAVARPLAEDPEALERVGRFYMGLAERGLVDDGGLTAARRKMAQVPQGARLLPNAAGAAPGVLLQAGAARIACLPGVPRELEAVFVDSLLPALEGLLAGGASARASVLTRANDESRLAPVLQSVARAHPAVAFKSRARGYGAEVRIEVTLLALAPTREAAADSLRTALPALLASLAREGLAPAEEEPPPSIEV